ncbi:MAG TPA: biotin carboxylase N-terminal domain-containing protein, partial [Candidatus Obscuribacter sp.]|nr:biotin carboxylase N-terminal domain-containing protein [Candidatus Obscuribacter sp.]
MIKRLIIVNRGEIAVRIIRTCRDLGITSIAVYDESDVGSLHVLLADESVKLDSPKTFTDPKQLLELARLRKADAIHP